MSHPLARRILLTNLHSLHNAGDAALMLAAIDQLQTAFPEVVVTLLLNDPSSYTGSLPVVGSLVARLKRADASGHETWRWVDLLGMPLLGPVAWLSRWWAGAVRLVPARWRALVQAYVEADLVVGCPGGYLFSAGLGLPLVLSVYTLALAWFAGKPFYLLPQSIGPFRREWERWLIGWLLARARLIMVREAISLQQAPLPVADRRVHLLPDMALTYTGAPVPVAQAWLQSVGLELAQARPCLGVTVINWQQQNPAFRSQSQYEQAIAAAVRRFLTETGGTAVFLPQVCGPSFEQDDRVAARRVAELLAEFGPRVSVVQTQPPPATLQTAMGLMDIVLGTRMHSNLFAMAGGVPFLAIGYQFKTQGIVQMVGLGDWVLAIEHATGDIVAQRLMDLWRQRVEIRAYLARTLPDLMRQARQAAHLIASDYSARSNT